MRLDDSRLRCNAPALPEGRASAAARAAAPTSRYMAAGTECAVTGTQQRSREREGEREQSAHTGRKSASAWCCIRLSAPSAARNWDCRGVARRDRSTRSSSAQVSLCVHVCRPRCLPGPVLSRLLSSPPPPAPGAPQLELRPRHERIESHPPPGTADHTRRENNCDALNHCCSPGDAEED